MLWPGTAGITIFLSYQGYAGIDLIFSPDGRVLASVGQDGEVIYLDVHLESVIASVCYKVRRNLTEDEWRYYMARIGPSEKPAHILKAWANPG